ncbi:MAG: HEPN domain-containing protein [Pseudomonadota bacterium]
MKSQEFFVAAGRLLADSPGTMVSKHRDPIYVLEGFAYELLLKGLIIEAGEEPKWIHDLTKLFDELTSEQAKLLTDAHRRVDEAFYESLDFIDEDECEETKISQKTIAWPAKLLEPRHSIEDGLRILTNWTDKRFGMLARYPPKQEAWGPGEHFDLDLYLMCNVGWLVCHNWIAKDRENLSGPK